MAITTIHLPIHLCMCDYMYIHTCTCSFSKTTDIWDIAGLCMVCENEGYTRVCVYTHVHTYTQTDVRDQPTGTSNGMSRLNGGEKNGIESCSMMWQHIPNTSPG